MQTILHYLNPSSLIQRCYTQVDENHTLISEEGATAAQKGSHQLISLREKPGHGITNIKPLMKISI